MKVLNLFAGIGGNRRLWNDCYVTAVEIDSNIADVYRSLYQKDKVVVGDALEYLEEYFNKFDFIWASPQCQTHGQYRHNIGVLTKGYKPLLPDMTLYSIIIFLKTYHNGLWCVENTVPYYKSLIAPSARLQRHLFWSNFDIPYKDFKQKNIRKNNKISDYEDCEIIAKSKIHDKRQALRNCVDNELGLYVYNCARGESR